MTKSRGIRPPRNAWTPADIATLLRRYPHEKTEKLAHDLGRKIGAIYQKAATIGLHKSDAYLASPEACRMRRGDNIGAKTRFAPGNPAWNKGMTGLDIGGAETRFKSGQAPHNTHPIGSYRITKDGTLQQKISDARGNSSKRWRGVHELVWIEANGPVPPGHIVVFKRGRRTNQLDDITHECVECISLAENMRRNTVHNMPKELVDLVRLRAVVNRQINKMERTS